MRFFDGATEIGSGPVGFNGLASAEVTFTTAGTHTITARYDGGFGFFDEVTSARSRSRCRARPSAST